MVFISLAPARHAMSLFDACLRHRFSLSRLAIFFDFFGCYYFMLSAPVSYAFRCFANAVTFCCRLAMPRLRLMKFCYGGAPYDMPASRYYALRRHDVAALIRLLMEDISICRIYMHASRRRMLHCCYDVCCLYAAARSVRGAQRQDYVPPREAMLPTS